MDAVADQLGADLAALRSCANDAGLAVMDGRHGVVQVRQMGHARINGSLGRVVVRVRVGDGYRTVVFGLTDKFHRALQLRRHVHDTHQTLGTVVESLECRIVRIAQVGAVLGALFLL